MQIIGELINSSRSQVKEAIEKGDSGLIKKLARDQVEAGADIIDVNAGTFYKKEPELLRWLTAAVQEEVDCPLCIDSPNPAALEAALEICRGKALVNSITAEEKRFKEIMPLVKKYGTGVIALTIDKKGISTDKQYRLSIAEDLVKALVAEGVSEDDIYIDPLVEPVSVESSNGLIALETIRGITERGWKVHSVCAFSNISFGLPGRKLLNQGFAVMAVTSGLDSAILNPCDRHLMGMVKAAMAIADRDPYCKGYINAYKKGLFQ